MKTILAFGDSLTWGTDAAAERRHAFADRWPNVLAAALGADVQVVAEGLGGRTTIYDDPDSVADKNGARALPILLGSHNPLDLVIIMLGANDLKPALCGRAEGAAKGIEQLVRIVKDYPYNWGAPAPEVLVVAPPHFEKKFDGSGPVGDRLITESRKLAELYRNVARKAAIGFFDVAPFARASGVDGVHLDAANTRAVGAALAPVVRELLSLAQK
ncbi:SGNH/GDSL hydrolase family protein [Chelativorans sp. AA-79]|uniref:SGNH/GDSL hydrolase family protein n=1 Tax=Chelativorans sp. AA-79 TaxID=3028735 RepID=UPI0023F7DA11|nr:SGNH/GDSL hydrolase family protein [Chelativorans sp. AA-79]WEX08694.1 SGNH/GDSL hydrolase family protein [Chelativorans sp. AA-79]